MIKRKYIKRMYIEEAYCDKCGTELVPCDYILMSSPPQFQYKCPRRRTRSPPLDHQPRHNA